MTDQAPLALVEVEIRRIPIPLWARTQEHIDELLREFTLMAAQLREHPESEAAPLRLIQLVQDVTQRFGGLNTDQENRLADAAVHGVPELDLVYRVPAQAAQASQQLMHLLDDADAYCEAGRHLLTLATPEDLRRFRRWFLAEFINQLDGADPVAFPDYDGG